MADEKIGVVKTIATQNEGTADLLQQILLLEMQLDLLVVHQQLSSCIQAMRLMKKAFWKTLQISMRQPHHLFV